MSYDFIIYILTVLVCLKENWYVIYIESNYLEDKKNWAVRIHVNYFANTLIIFDDNVEETWS